MLTDDSIRNENELPKDFSARKGWFRVSKAILDLPTPELMEFMSNFLIVRAEFLYEIDAMEYYAVSELFDPVDEALEIPEYAFRLTKQANGALVIKAIKVTPEKGKKLLRLLRRLDG